VSLHDEAVAIRNARFIIEQALIHRSEARRAMSWFGFLGKGQWPPLHQPWVCERCKYSWWVQRKAQPPNTSSAVLPESCFTVFMCTNDSAKYRVARLSLWEHCPKIHITGYGPAKILPGIIWNHHTVAQWLGRRSVAGGLSLIYAWSMVDV